MICTLDYLMLAWRPLIDPLPVDDLWLWMLLPLILGISVVYKAIKMESLEGLPRQAISLAAQFIVLMVIAAAVLWLLTELA